MVPAEGCDYHLIPTLRKLALDQVRCMDRFCRRSLFKNYLRMLERRQRIIR